MEEVDDHGPSVVNGECNNSGFSKNRFHNINKSEVETYLNATDKNAVEEDTVNDKTKESPKGVNSDTSIDNGVYGRVEYDQFK